MISNTNLIISLAINGRDAYEEIQKGLVKTLPIADCDTWILNHYPENVTPHKIVPYKFKYDLINKAKKEGYKKIFWLDSTMRLLKNPFELFEQSPVVAFHNVGHPLKNYISDYAASLLGYKDKLDGVSQTWGGALGFDFTQDIAHILFGQIYRASYNGAFDEGGSSREGFIAHRHDQACMSVLLHQYGINLFDYGVIAAPNDVTDKTYIQYGDR